MTKRLQEIQARMDAATPGPWAWEMAEFCTGWKALNAVGRNDVTDNTQLRVLYVRNDGEAGMNNTDAAFIANAPSDIAWLLERCKKLEAAAKRVVSDYEEAQERLATGRDGLDHIGELDKVLAEIKDDVE